MKIGVFPGSFNPPHNDHLKIAKELYTMKMVDKVIYVPTSNKYNKQDLIESYKRFDMLEILANKNPFIEVSDIEIKKETQNYTYETLDEIKRVYPQADIYLIVGMDNFNAISSWKNYDYIINNYKIICIDRGNQMNDITSKVDSNIKVTFVKCDLKGLSSTEIRNKILLGEDVTDYLDYDIIKYIMKEQLYEGVKYAKNK